MAKTPDNLKASPMEHVHVRLPNLRNTITRAAADGAESVTVQAEGEAETVDIQTTSGTAAKKGAR